ncbi:MAG: ABC transporter permease, partial [Muribaculaceae bacterium]|nr:ABC transporter permease [Muribaculaceae bacterium]
MTTSPRNLLRRLLRAHLSPWRIAGFIVSNLLGLAIICAGVQIYADLRGLLHSGGNVVDTGYLVLNKRVTASTMLGDSSSDFSTDEIASLRAQPWVRGVGRFTASGYEVRAGIEQGGRGMSTMLFFEAVPDSFVDVSASDWHYEPGQREVPIIIARDYLTLYNFGFASGAGLPRVSEQVMSGLPISLRLNGDDGRQMQLTGRIVGYSDRLNTVLVPESFMNWSNEVLAPRR